MVLSQNLGTGVAFDNFDRFVETLSGKDTLHDTVGIAYQIVSEEPTVEESSEPEYVCVAASRKKRRRAFQTTGLDIEPYRKPRMLTVPVLPLDDPRRTFEPESYLNARAYDSLWMMNFCFSPNDTPMWVGWNAKVFPNKKELQKVWYVPQINQSPTPTAVVAETMRHAQGIANESKKESISVTYDLAIAKVAMQIQAKESPRNHRFKAY
ncbi:Hypothetical predicted protein [Paramuricea clavata]|uniref:Uncharacterized protein n=1 Tax=Paramuricea clavata TaxID=317549 RepID=A0A6S7LIM7_PARCT|nr:Hypothetical predicted protein [Paramuricea clavata]